MPRHPATPLSPKLSGRLALVSGANRGIGLSIARALAHEGCNLIITGRDERALAKARAELEKLNVRVLAHSCDVRSPDSVDYLFAVVRGLRKPLDILVNNAGIGHPNRTVGELPYPTWMEVIDTNLNGLFLMTQAALAVMKRGGTIVNNLSIAAERIFPGSAAYNASKHGGLGFTNTLREELRSKWHSRHRADARRDRYRNLGHAVAEGAQAENDVPRNRRPCRGRCAALAGKHDRGENRRDAVKWHSLKGSG